MEFIEYLKRKLAPSTAKRYEREVDIFAEAYELKIATYQQIIEYLQERRKGQKNVAPILHALQKYYDFLIQKGERKDNPAKGIRLRNRRRKEVALQDLFTRKELEKLLGRKERYQVLKNKNQIIISLLIYQGLTNGEIKQLVLGDIDLNQGLIQIKAGRKTNSRVLKLRSNQILLIDEYLKKDRPELLGKSNLKTEKLLISKLGQAESGEGISYLIETLKPLFPKRNLNAKTIRQSVIANLLKEGKDLRLVQVFAGHKYPSTTERYRQTEIEELKNQVLKYHPLQ